MKIEELVTGKNDNAEIQIEGAPIPVKALRNLINDGYIHIKSYRENKTYSLWGKNCSACLTVQELRGRGNG